MKHEDLYMLNDEMEHLYCDRCDKEVRDDSELYPYYDMMVCDRCVDILRLRDEKESIELECDGMIDYDA